VMLMDGTRTQSQIVEEAPVHQGNLTRIIHEGADFGRDTKASA